MLDFQVIVKNNGGSAVAINDLNLSIPAAGQRDLSASFDPSRIIGSDDLQTLVANSTLVVNDGTDDLSAAEAATFLTLQTRKDLEDRFPSKLQLASSTSGVQVSYNLLVDKPAYGNPEGCYPPVQVLANGIGLATPPETPVDGDAYVDDSNHIQIYDGTQWVDNGAATGVVINAGLVNEAAKGTRVINIADADQSIFEFDGTNWRDLGAPTDNYTVIVNDYGDGEKEAQFLYSSEESEFKLFAFFDFSKHFDGGDGKHDASEVNIEGDYDNISQGTLENGLSEIDTKLTSLDQSVADHDLNSAYLAGRSVTANQGAVILDASAQTTAALQINEHSELPSTGLAGGQIAAKAGILCLYDSTRSKWLSIYRKDIKFGKDGFTQNMNLEVSGVSNNNAGSRVPRATTITGISCQLSEAGTCSLKIRKNNELTDLGTLAISAAAGNSDTSLNIALAAGDHVQLYLESAAGVKDPVVSLEIAETP